MLLNNLVEQLHSLGVTRPTKKDPRIPPILNDVNYKKHSKNLPKIVKIPVQDILTPVKKTNPDSFEINPELRGRDWLEEIDGYSILYEKNIFSEDLWSDPEHPDCWAWYCPFHFYEEGAGIYVRGDKLSIVKKRILTILTAKERKQLMKASRENTNLFGEQIEQAAFLHFFLHEMYHHKVESFATRLEIASGAPKFVPYHDSVYYPLSHPLNDKLIEEGLANAEVIRRAKFDKIYSKAQFPKITGVPSVAKLWLEFEFQNNLRCKLKGYRTVKSYIDTKTKNPEFLTMKFFQHQRKLQQMVNQASEKPLGNSQRWKFAPGMMAPFWNEDLIAYEVLYPGHQSKLVPGGA